MCSLAPRLSTVNSEDYKVWKSETLAKQSYQLEPLQTTGIWNRSMLECEVGEMRQSDTDSVFSCLLQIEFPSKNVEKDKFVVELAPGYR